MKTIISLLTIIGIVFAAYFYIDDRYAKCADVRQVEKRLDYKIVSDQFNAIQERLWKIKDRFKGKPMDETVAEEVRGLETTKGQLNEKLKGLEK